MRALVAGLIVAFLAFGAVSTVNAVGKPREPLTSHIAAVSVVVVALISAGVLWLALTK